MFCKMIGICGGCTSKANIKDEMNHKSNFIQSLFGLDSLEIFDSPDVGYRTRAEFRIHTEKYENQKNQSKQQQVANQEQQKQEQEGQKKQQEQQNKNLAIHIKPKHRKEPHKHRMRHKCHKPKKCKFF